MTINRLILPVLSISTSFAASIYLSFTAIAALFSDQTHVDPRAFCYYATIKWITLRITKCKNVHLFYLNIHKDNNDNENERVLRHMLCRIITWTFNIIKDHTYNNICVHLTLRFQEVCNLAEWCAAWFYCSSSNFWWLYA